MRILVTEGWIQAACWVINLPILLSDFAAAPVRRQGRENLPSLDCARLRGFFHSAGWEEKMVEVGSQLLDRQRQILLAGGDVDFGRIQISMS